MPSIDRRVPARTVHNDEPSFQMEKDHFGQAELIKSIAETIGKRAEPPFVASLNGDWGQGKTSILEAVYECMTGVKPKDYTGQKPNVNFSHVRVIWFDAWRYQHDPTPIVALLNEIRNQLEKMSVLANYGGKAKKLTQIAVESSLQSLVSLTAGVYGFAGHENLVETIKKTGNSWEQRNHRYALPSQTIRELLNKAVEDILDKLVVGKGTTPRLVIIIDDLDRCQPIVAYKLLEGLKIFLNLPSCTFLIGCNRTEIVRAIGVGLHSESGIPMVGENNCHANEYFEKLCSYSWDIPFPTPKESARYLCGLLSGSEGDFDPNLYSGIKNVLDSNNYRILPANPRRIKTYANTLIRLAGTARNQPNFDIPSEEEAGFLLTLSYIVAFMPELHRHVLANPLALRDLSTRAAELYVIGNEQPDHSVLTEKNPILKAVPDPDQLHYLPPEVSDKLRMGPILAHIAMPTDDLIKKYLPHALR